MTTTLTLARLHDLRPNSQTPGPPCTDHSPSHACMTCAINSEVISNILNCTHPRTPA